MNVTRVRWKRWEGFLVRVSQQDAVIDEPGSDLRRCGSDYSAECRELGWFMGDAVTRPVSQAAMGGGVTLLFLFRLEAGGVCVRLQVRGRWMRMRREDVRLRGWTDLPGFSTGAFGAVRNTLAFLPACYSRKNLDFFIILKHSNKSSG